MRVTKVMSMVLPLALSMALAVGVQAKTKSGKSSAKGTPKTVTGCLQAGSSPNTFVLNSGSSEQEKSSKDMSGSTPSQMARSESSSYTLIPQNNIDLQKWVGQRVRVTGRMASSTSSSSNPSASSSSESSSSSGSSMESSMGGSSELMVTSIRKVGGSCQ